MVLNYFDYLIIYFERLLYSNPIFKWSLDRHLKQMQQFKKIKPNKRQQTLSSRNQHIQKVDHFVWILIGKLAKTCQKLPLV